MESQTLTISDALEIVENNLTTLNLTDHNGKQLIGIECIAYLHKLFPNMLAELENGFQNGEITTKQYVEDMLKLIACAKKSRLLLKTDNLLSSV